MADANTVQLSAPHAPKPASIEAFKSCLHEIKNMFHHSRTKWDEHEPEMYSRCHGHSDHELLEPVDLDKDLVQIRTAESAYGLHLFGKIKIAKVEDAYIHVRLFVSEQEAKVHAIHTEEKEKEGGKKSFTAIFREKDPLEWFSE